MALVTVGGIRSLLLRTRLHHGDSPLIAGFTLQPRDPYGPFRFFPCSPSETR